MRSSDWLTTDQVSTIFAEEISARGGTVHDTFDDGAALFARSILPQLAEVPPGDRVQGGRPVGNPTPFRSTNGQYRSPADRRGAAF